MSYAGRITGPDGKPVRGSTDLKLTLFRSAFGEERIPVSSPVFTDVALRDGVFQIELDLPADELHTVFTAVDQVWIEITDLGSGTVYSQGGGIAQGIAEALFTTQLGLAVAIPGFFVSRMLERREEQLLSELEQTQGLLGGAA